MSANNVAADLITYMSNRLLEVAECDTILDQYGWKDKSALIKVETLPSTESKVGYKFVYKALVTNPNWIRVIDKDGTWNESISYNCFNYDDEGAYGLEPPTQLQVRVLTPEERASLESELPF